MGFALPWLKGVLNYDTDLAMAFAFIVPLELVFPRKAAGVSLASRARAALFWIAWTPFTVATILLAQAAWRHFGIHPLIGSLAPPNLPRPISLTVGAMAAALVGDFFYYWCHRAQHRFLWRFHAIHHSVRELSGVAAYHHITEEAIKVVLYFLPVGLFIDDPLGLPIVGAILGLQGHYLHSTTRLNLGPLGRFIQDNRFHRIHHSIQPEHFDKNFGVFTTLWDCLFGTAYFPAPNEWPATGLADAPAPSSITDFYLRPFWAKPATVLIPQANEASTALH